MGSQFALVFDIITAAVLIFTAFAGWRKGFAKMILEVLAVAVAFGASMIFSGPISEAVYGSYIEKPLTEKINETVDESFSTLHLGSVSGADFEKVAISGVPVSAIEPNYSGTNNAVFDLSDLDLSQVGLTAENLRTLGLEEDLDLTSVNAKTAEFSKQDIEKYGTGKLAYSQFAALSLIKKGDLENLNEYIEMIAKYIPGGVKTGGSDNVTVSAARKLVLSMLETQSNVRDAVMTDIIRPNCIILIRTIVFAVIFAAVSIGLGFVAKASKMIDKIPVIGKANSAIGGIAGLVEGIVAVFSICLVTRLAVSLLGENAILFNQATIDSTFLFGRFYEFDFLNFLR